MPCRRRAFSLRALLGQRLSAQSGEFSNREFPFPHPW